MKDCFALRFNLQKSGIKMMDNSELFANLFNEKDIFIKECLDQYNNFLSEAADEILKDYDINRLKTVTRDKKILFMGDSITSDRLSFGKIAAEVLPCSVTDCAVSGSRAINVAADINSCMETYKPNIVSVLIGTNDAIYTDKSSVYTATSPKEYARNLKIIAERVSDFGALLILNSIPPVFVSRFNEMNPNWSAKKETNDIFNDIIYNLSIELGFVYNDFRTIFSTWEVEKLFEPDGIHLSPFAHKQLARKFVEILLENL